jgi:hypothetical protein
VKSSKDVRKPVRMSDVKIRIQKNIEDHKDALAKMPDPVVWLMREEMRVSEGGISPLFLRPLVAIEYFGDDAIPKMLEKLLFETSNMRIHMNDSQQRELDAVEEAAQAMIEGLRAKHNKEVVV